MIADGGEIVIEKKPFIIGKPLVLILIVVCVFVVAIGIGIAVSVFLPRKRDIIYLNNEPTPVISQTPKYTSKLATDAAMLQLKSDIAGFASELDRIDLAEPQLAPPNIDLNIGIEIK